MSSRPVMGPEVLGSPTRLGRWVPSQITPPDWVTARGMPLWRANTALTSQPPRTRSARRFQPEPHLRSRPKGSCHTAVRTRR